MPEPRYFGNLVPYGQPTVAKADTRQTARRAHHNWEEHDHGPEPFSEKDLTFLQERGYHVDPHTSFVYDHSGHRVSPGNVGHILAEARKARSKQGGGDVVNKVAGICAMGTAFDVRAATGTAPGET